MLSAVDQLATVIAAHLREWGGAPHVELTLFGTADARTIAAEIAAFCRRELGSAPARGLWHQSSIGAVSGLQLEDGRRVVVKGHQPHKSLETLREIVRTQRHLASSVPFVPAVLSGPAPLGRGHAVVEPLIDAGATPDAHEPAVRSAMARGLREIIAACRPLVAASTLTEGLLGDVPRGALWPTPHSKLFDFDATARGAEWIDALARASRERVAPVGEVVIGHGDWRAEHVRFAEGRPVAAFDWDSLCRDHEPRLIGIVAHAFCADWTRNERIAPAPTLDEARAFVREYEEARGSPLSREEREQCGAAFAYSCAYTARCGWALGTDERDKRGTFHHLIAEEGTRLLQL